MSISDVLAIVGCMFTVLGCTWYMSARLEKIQTGVKYTNEKLAEHIDDTDKRLDRHGARFDEVFSQQRELANQLFWLKSNVKAPTHSQSHTNMQG